MRSALYVGHVRHRRQRPVAHAFRYRVFQVYLDLAELDEVFRGRWFWSTRRAALARFDRRDHLGDPAQPLDDAVRDLVEQTTGRRPTGPVRLLTHLRYFGYVMNPVSFFYCFDEADTRVDTIAAEINNTPWGERHCYVLTDAAGGAARHFAFRKAFHVSPFMPMTQDYDWRFSAPGERLAVHMVNSDADGRLFDATLALERRPITTGSLAGVLLRYPAMTAQVIAGIYWQALRLWWKGAPYHPHPSGGRAGRTTADANTERTA